MKKTGKSRWMIILLLSGFIISTIFLSYLLRYIEDKKSTGNEKVNRRQSVLENNNNLSSPPVCNFFGKQLIFDFQCSWGGVNERKSSLSSEWFYTFSTRPDIELRFIHRSALPTYWGMHAGHGIDLTENLWQKEKTSIEQNAAGSTCEVLNNIYGVSGQLCQVVDIDGQPVVHRLQYYNNSGEHVFLENYTWFTEEYQLSFSLLLHSEINIELSPELQSFFVKYISNSNVDFSRRVSLEEIRSVISGLKIRT